MNAIRNLIRLINEAEVRGDAAAVDRLKTQLQLAREERAQAYQAQFPHLIAG